MPISVACPSCAARLNAPDQAAGKAVRCPKCQTPVSVPKPVEEDLGFEVVDDVPPVPAVKKSGPQPVAPAKAAKESGERPSQRAAPRNDEGEPEDRPTRRRPPRDEAEDDDRPSKRRPADEDEGEEQRPSKRQPADEDEDRQRGKKAASPQQKLKQRGLIAGAVGGLLFVALIGVSIYQITAAFDRIADRDQNRDGFPGQFNNQQPFGGAGRPAGMPAGWEKFNDPLSEVEIYFPDGQPEKNDAASAQLVAAIGGPADLWTKVVGDKVYLFKRQTLPQDALKKNSPEKILNMTVDTEREASPGTEVSDRTGYISNVIQAVVVSFVLNSTDAESMPVMRWVRAW